MPLNANNPLVTGALMLVSPHANSIFDAVGVVDGAALASLVVSVLKIPGFTYSCFISLGGKGFLLSYNKAGQDTVLIDFAPFRTQAGRAFKYDGLDVVAATKTEWVAAGLQNEYQVQPCTVEDQLEIEEKKKQLEMGRYGAGNQQLAAGTGTGVADDVTVTSALTDSSGLTAFLETMIPVAPPIPMPVFDQAALEALRAARAAGGRVTETKFYRRQRESATTRKPSRSKAVCPGWRLKENL